MILGQAEGVPEGTESNPIHSYAIPTTDLYQGEGKASEENKNQQWKKKSITNGQKTVTDDELNKSIKTFIEYADKNKNLKFMVTSIGTGIAGFSEKEMAQKFAQATTLSNVYLPMVFWMELFEERIPEGYTPSDMVPCKSKPVHQFQDELTHQLALYCQWLRNKLSNRPKTIERRKLIMTVERNCRAIQDAVDLMYRGLPSQAYDKLKECLEPSKEISDYIKFTFRFDEQREQNKYYRLREEKDNWVKRDVDAYGMFHLPYNLRHLASTQRYSVPGYPSLYMGEHVFSCWEERGRPNLSNCLISRIVNKKIFKILDLTIPDPACWDKVGEEEFQYQVLLFPFIIASTFKTTSNTATFKPEYIIPQLLFQYVKNKAFELNKERKNSNKSIEVYGIKYTSVHFPGYNSGKDRSQYDNYVVPVLNIKNLYCKELCEHFLITPPFCIDYSDISMINNVEAQTDTANTESNTKDKNVSAKASTIFEKIEDVLASLTPQKIESKGPRVQASR